jgi:hypothetical protein
MSKLVVFIAALAFVSTSVWAQNNRGPMPVPSAQNSGAGIAGQAGSKNGPPPKQTTTGSSIGAASNGQSVRQQDSAKIPGKAGGKSGPAVEPPGK